MNQRLNTTLDDIAAVAGFTAATHLAMAWGGTRVYVPLQLQDDMPLVVLLGRPTAQRLVDEWPGEYLTVPTLRVLVEAGRMKRIRELLQAKTGTKDVAEKTGLTTRRVRQIRQAMVAHGLLPAGDAF